MTDRLTEIEQRAAKATPGPWEESVGRNENAVVTKSVPYPSEHQVRYGGHPIADCEFYDTREAELNCVFICWAREDIPWLTSNIGAALAHIDAIVNERGWREVPVGELNRIKDILLGGSDASD